MFFERFTKANIKGVVGEGVSRLFFMGLDANEYKVHTILRYKLQKGKQRKLTM